MSTAFEAIVMAGGSGTRFWPWGRRARPKQLLPLLDGQSPLERTLARLAGFEPAPRVRIVAGPDLARSIAAELPELASDSILVEPEARDTAACVALACARVLVGDEPGEARDTVVAFLPADHAIDDEDGFRKTLALAVDRASTTDALCVLGMQPTRPATGYGWIERGASLGERCFDVRRFVEKPQLDAARAMLDAGTFLWNAGVCVWRVTSFLGACARHAPELARATEALAAAFERGRDDEAERVFRSIQKTSIDFALLENAERVEVIEADFDWRDLGSFDALAAGGVADTDGNVVILDGNGETLSIDAANSLAVVEGEHLVALLGTEGLVVVHTPDATLVAPRERSEEVRRLAARLRERGREDLL